MKFEFKEPCNREELIKEAILIEINKNKDSLFIKLKGLLKRREHFSNLINYDEMSKDDSVESAKINIDIFADGADLETIKKQPDVWMPRFEQLQQRSNGMLGKLMRTAGPEWAQRLKGTIVRVMSNDQWVQGNAGNRTVSLDLTVFWDAPDSTLAFAIAHELGHIALAHNDQPDPGKDDFAIKLCRALGYNKVEMFKFLHQKQSDYDFYNSITKLPNSSHPSYDQRINRAKKQGFQLSKGGVQQMNTLMTHLA